MTDHVWAVHINTLPKIAAMIKKMKKFSKLGFYVEVEELDEKDNIRLCAAYRKDSSFTLHGKPIDKKIVDSALQSLNATTTQVSFYAATFKGPKLLNGKPVNAD